MYEHHIIVFKEHIRVFLLDLACKKKCIVRSRRRRISMFGAISNSTKWAKSCPTLVNNRQNSKNFQIRSNHRPKNHLTLLSLSDGASHVAQLQEVRLGQQRAPTSLQEWLSRTFRHIHEWGHHRQGLYMKNWFLVLKNLRPKICGFFRFFRKLYCMSACQTVKLSLVLPTHLYTVSLQRHYKLVVCLVVLAITFQKYERWKSHF
jgi:hypothetical protein